MKHKLHILYTFLDKEIISFSFNEIEEFISDILDNDFIALSEMNSSRFITK
jgi:hypothetical protein